MRVLGRERSEGPVCHLGTYRARDGSAGARVGVDLDRPHVALVVGKRGSGKSHTLGVLAEGLARVAGVAPVVADPMGAFEPLAAADVPDVPARAVDPAVAADALAPRDWCRLLGLSPEDGPGSLVWRAAAESATLDEMVAFVGGADAPEDVCRAATNHLRLAASWGVFDPDGLPDLTADGGCAVLALAGRDRAAMNAVVAGVAGRLYDDCVAGAADRLPWLLVDEAHAFFEGVAGPALRRLATRGRQPGVSLVAATQRPSALPAAAVSQADLLIVHRLTSRADREALADARPAYLTGSLADRMPEATGEAVVIDDRTETVHGVRVRERETPHGGASPRASARPDTESDE